MKHRQTWQTNGVGVIASVAKQSRVFFTTLAFLLSLSLGTTAHAYPSHNIALPNGEYIETTEDLKVKAIGGHITAKRVWTNSRWYMNPEWADLKFVAYDPLDGSVKDIDRAGAIYERRAVGWDGTEWNPSFKRYREFKTLGLCYASSQPTALNQVLALASDR